MSSIQLGFDDDILITNNSITLTTGLEAIRQHLQVRLRLFLGEWFLDTTVGVPWFQQVFQKNTTFIVVQQVLKDAILSTPGVIQLLKFNFDYAGATREATLDFQALTEEGIIDFSQIVDV